MGIEARGFENPEWTKFCGEALTEPEMKCPIFEAVGSLLDFILSQ